MGIVSRICVTLACVAPLFVSSQQAVPCSPYPEGDWGVPYYPQEVGGGGYPVGVRSNLTDCIGCTASIDGVNWTLPYFGFPEGATVTVEGRVWTNWQYTQQEARDMVRVDLRAAYTIHESGSSTETNFPQIIMEFNPMYSNQSFVVRGQSAPSVWTYEDNYSWPFPADAVFPTQGYDELYPLFPGETPKDSNETLWMQIVRVSGGYNVSAAILPGFNVTGYPNTTFFVSDFDTLPTDNVGTNQVFGVWVMGLNNVNVQMWGKDFAGVPPPLPTSVPTESPASTGYTGPSPSTTKPGGGQTTAEGGSTAFVAPGAGIFAPVMASIGGGLLAATGAAMAYYALSGSNSIPESEMDIQDFPDDDMEDIPSMEDSMDGDLESSFNAENYVDVDPDNSFWRATSQDQYV